MPKTTNKNNQLDGSSDEVFFKDPAGKMKVLHQGTVSDWQKTQIIPKREERREEPRATKLLPLDEVIQEIIKESGLTFADEVLRKRLEKIILSRLKDVRDQIETREMLLRPVKIGGIGLSADQTEKILRIISQKLETLDDRMRDLVNQEPFTELRKEAKKILEQTDLQPPPPLVYKPASEKIPKSPAGKEEVIVKTPPPVSPPPKVEKKPEPAKPKPTKFPISYTQRPPSETKRPRIEDVKFVPRLVGPVEELRSMTLIDFRRLSSNPSQAAEKILEKIRLLEKESFTKRILGIKAWQQSEVYRLYLVLGEQGMEQKKPVFEIIQQRQSANQPTLTIQEFEAIMDLNQKLRY